MTTQLAKVDGELWFFTKRESPKADEIRDHHRVSLSYAKPEDNSYVSVSGKAELITDPKKAQELWDPIYEQWFPQGASDPSLILIRVTVEQAEYWHAPSSAFTLQAGFVVLAPERRANPEFHAKIAMLSECGPVISTTAPCSSCGMFHTTLYHRAFPHLCGQGDTPQERAQDLIRRLANEKDVITDTCAARRWSGRSPKSKPSSNGAHEPGRAHGALLCLYPRRAHAKPWDGTLAMLRHSTQAVCRGDGGTDFRDGKSNGRFVYCSCALANSSNKTHCDGFLNSRGEPVVDDHSLAEAPRLSGT